MALLKKIKASSLMETLVATVLIVIIFMISSMVLNNIVASNIRQNTERIEERMNRLVYEYSKQAYQLPHQVIYEPWEISIFSDKNENSSVVVFEALNRDTKRVLTQRMIHED